MNEIVQLCESTVCPIYDAVGGAAYHGTLFVIGALAYVALIAMAPKFLKRFLTLVGMVGFMIWAVIIAGELG